MLTVHRPGTTAVLWDGRKEIPVLVNTVSLRSSGYVSYEVSWIDDGFVRRQVWVEACELKAGDCTESTEVGWIHPVHR